MAGGRPGDRTFFIYDHCVVQKEEDDPKDAIVYFYPHHISTNTKCLFCGQLMGMVNLMKTLGSSPPQLYRLKKLKIATKHEANFTLALASKQRTPDDAVREKLEHLYSIFAFYHGSLQKVLLESGNKRELFLNKMDAIWDCYLPFIRRYGNTIPAMFEPIPRVQLPKSAKLLFLRCSHLLQWLKSKTQLLGGCILYKNSVLCTQLTPELTSRLLLIKPNQSHLPSKMVTVEYNLPYGVRIMSVYLTDTEHKLFVKKTEMLPASCTSQGKEKKLKNPTTYESSNTHNKPGCVKNCKGALHTIDNKSEVQFQSAEMPTVLNIQTEMKVRMQDIATDNIGVSVCKELAVSTETLIEDNMSVEEGTGVKSSFDELRGEDTHTDNGISDEIKTRYNTQESTANVGNNLLSQCQYAALDSIPWETTKSNESRHENMKSQNGQTTIDLYTKQSCELSATEKEQLDKSEALVNSECNPNLKINEVSGRSKNADACDSQVHESQIEVLSKASNDEPAKDAGLFQRTLNSHPSGNIPINKPVPDIDRNRTDNTVNINKCYGDGQSPINTIDSNSKHSNTNLVLNNVGCDLLLEAKEVHSDDVSKQVEKNAVVESKVVIQNDETELSNWTEDDNDEDKVPSCRPNAINRKQLERNDAKTIPELGQSDITEDREVGMTSCNNSTCDSHDSCDGKGSSDDDKQQFDGSLNSLNKGTKRGNGRSHSSEHIQAGTTCEEDKQVGNTSATCATSDDIIDKVEGMVNVSLYVQAHSDMVILYLAENSFVQDKTALFQLWRSVLTELGELEPKLKQCVQHHTLQEESIYNYIQYDNFDRLVQSSLDNPVTPVQSEFCRAADMLHHKFSKDDNMTDVIVRNHRTAVYAHQNASHQTFVQNRRSPPNSTGIPTRDDMSFFLDASAQKLMYRDHGINLL